MTKTQLYLFMLFLGISLGCRAQQMPIMNIQSPEVANLGQYGMIPVSKFTGVPDISVPLYEVKTGKYSFPISASYHLASVKPGLQPGCLGLGWNLLADGYITRNVRGEYDEKCRADGYASGFYAHASKLKGMDANSFFEACKHLSDDDGKYYELSADEFSFSFCGYSGNFYFNEDGGWSVVSESDIKVEFDPTNGFIDLNALSKRINTARWNQRSNNNRFFNKFTLVTPDGCRYEFGGLNATEYSIPYYSRNASDLIPTTWRLTKITTLDKRTIEFDYDASAIVCDLRYVPQKKVVYDIPCTPNNPVSGRDALTGFLVFPVNVKTIKTSDETLTFTYFREYGYSDSFGDGFLAWSSNTPYDREDIFHQLDNPANQFSVFLGNIPASPIASLRDGIKSKLIQQVLHSLRIETNTGKGLKTIYFDYTFKNRRKLSLITEREGNPELIPEYNYGNPHAGAIFVGYKIPAISSKKTIPEYRFSYNTSQTMPYNYLLPATDFWGYYLGKNVSLADYVVFNYELDPPSSIWAKAEILTEVTYPTGGKSRFEYQLNRYSQVVTSSRKFLEKSSGAAGGLRINRITNLDRDGNVLNMKKYYYSESKRDSSNSSGILKSAPLLKATYNYVNGFMFFGKWTLLERATLELTSKGGFFASVTNLNSPEVGYSCVIEETLNGNKESLGYVKYRYSNYDTDIYGKNHFDESAICSNLSGESYIVPFSSRSMERGKLLSEEYYGTNNQLKKKITYKYKEVNPGYFVTASQSILFFCSDMVEPRYSFIGSLIKTYTSSYLTDSITETQYLEPGNTPLAMAKSYDYTKHKLIRKESGKTSSGKNYAVGYKYPGDDFKYIWMENKNILSPVIEKKITEENSSKIETYYYSAVDEIPYQSMMTTDIGGSNRTNYKVNRVDSYGNPTEVEEKGLTTVLIWGAEGQRLIAKIENATYSRVYDLMGVSPGSFSSKKNSQIDYQIIEGIRHKLTSSHFYIYKYNSRLLLVSETNPNGLTTYYAYDYQGHLREKYIYKLVNGEILKHVVNVIDYHYYNDGESESN